METDRNGMTFMDMLGLVPALAVAYGVILGAVVLATGWQLLTDRKPPRYRRHAAVPPVGAIEPDNEGAR